MTNATNAVIAAAKCGLLLLAEKEKRRGEFRFWTEIALPEMSAWRISKYMKMAKYLQRNEKIAPECKTPVEQQTLRQIYLLCGVQKVTSLPNSFEKATGLPVLNNQVEFLFHVQWPRLLGKTLLPRLDLASQDELMSWKEALQSPHDFYEQVCDRLGDE